MRLPGRGQSVWKNIYTLVSEPVFKGTFSGILFEPLRPQRPHALNDESIGSFLSRRFGAAIADNFASALVHGIYAGDIYQLSVCSIFPKLWLLEGLNESVGKGLWKSNGNLLLPREDIELLKNPLKSVDMKGSSTFTFVGGVGELADTLADKLEKNPNVTIQKQTIVQSLELQKAELCIQV